jgi:hypothetical protein
MTDIHPVARASRGIFRGIPAPVLLLISATLFVMLGVDLLVPDLLPLLDEAALAFLLYGSTSSLLGRRSRDAGVATEAVSVGRLLKEVDAAARDVDSLARSLRKAGHPLPALGGLQGLRDRTAADSEALRALDATLSRKENDPWQIEREVGRLERSVAEAEAGGELPRRESLEVALQGARIHARQVGTQSAERDRLVTTLRGRAGRLRTLEATLRVLDTQGEAPDLPQGVGEGWEPELAAVLADLRDVAVATAELDAMAEPAPTRPRGRQQA